MDSIKLTNFRTCKNGIVYNVIDSNIVQLGQFKPYSLNYDNDHQCIYVDTSPHNFATNNAVALLSDLRNDFYKQFLSSISLPKPKNHIRFKLNIIHFRVLFENDSYNVNHISLTSIFRTSTVELCVRPSKLFVFNDDFILSFSVISIKIMEISPCLATIIKKKDIESISIKKYNKNDIKSDIKKIFDI